MEPDATPPHALMKLGSDTVIELTPINTVPAPCLTSVVGSSLVWVSSDPSVATVHGIGTSDVATVTALSPGDTEIFAEGAQTSGVAFRAQLTGCSRQATPCVLVNLVLRVVP
jgi:hypothetical protein